MIRNSVEDGLSASETHHAAVEARWWVSLVQPIPEATIRTHMTHPSKAYAAVESLNEKLRRARALCLDQAAGFVSAAERLSGEAEWSHVVYHLSLLALEEVGKASMLGVRMINHDSLDGSWVDRSFDSHRRKLQWAVWSPMTRIEPADFEAARQFAERAHAMRLASLYVDPKAELTDLPPRDVVQPVDAEKALDLARARLEHERAHGIPSGEVDELTEWFLDTMANPERSRLMLSPPFIAKYEELSANPREWARWVREEMERGDPRELRTLAEAELKRPAAAKGAEKPRWRANLIIYTPSHSIRAKALTRWNERFDHVQLLWAGKKDRFTLQITLHDNLPVSSLHGRLSSLAKIGNPGLSKHRDHRLLLVRASLASKKEIFKGVQDLKLDPSGSTF